MEQFGSIMQLCVQKIQTEWQKQRWSFTEGFHSLLRPICYNKFGGFKFNDLAHINSGLYYFCENSFIDY